LAFPDFASAMLPPSGHYPIDFETAFWDDHGIGEQENRPISKRSMAVIPKRNRTIF
jgi:hypothetical protein